MRQYSSIFQEGNGRSRGNTKLVADTLMIGTVLALTSLALLIFASHQHWRAGQSGVNSHSLWDLDELGSPVLSNQADKGQRTAKAPVVGQRIGAEARNRAD